MHGGLALSFHTFAFTGGTMKYDYVKQPRHVQYTQYKALSTCRLSSLCSDATAASRPIQVGLGVRLDKRTGEAFTAYTYIYLQLHVRGLLWPT